MALPTVETFAVKGPLHITPLRFIDSRGSFSETYNASDFGKIGVDSSFIQDNHSVSFAKGTIRGMHFQAPPFAQAKLVRVLRGSIYDVAVDLRRHSATYGKSAAITLSAQQGDQLFVPSGFAHGFCTLEDNTEILYKVDAPYSRDHERGLLWNDPLLEIAWPVGEREAILLDRDCSHPVLHNLPFYFS